MGHLVYRWAGEPDAADRLRAQGCPVLAGLWERALLTESPWDRLVVSREDYERALSEVALLAGPQALPEYEPIRVLGIEVVPDLAP